MKNLYATIRVLCATLILCATFGCANFKMAVVNGHMNVVSVKREVKHEKNVWAFVVERYGKEAQAVERPMTHSNKLNFVQTAYETIEQSRRDRIMARNPDVIFPPIKKVVGFYNPTSHLVVYVTGEYGTLAHEYCHALNNKLKLNLTPVQDEYFCERVKEDYEGILEVQRLKHQNRELQRELNSRRFR